MSLRLAAVSTQYVYVPVVDALLGADPTGDVVRMAFPPPNVTPGAGDWKTADWVTVGTTHLARCLVGPAGVLTLPTGPVLPWVTFTGLTEVPALPAATPIIVI
jgi:hypothetical protein